MEINEQAILRKTSYGLDIYAHVLRAFYPGEVVIHLSGKKCLPARNPFTDGAQTLLLENRDWVFYYHDSLNPNFKGDPFHFAALLFNLSDMELLAKIDEELNLGIAKNRSFYANAQNTMYTIPMVKNPTVTTPKFSFFRRPIKNTVPSNVCNLLDVYNLIKSDKYKANTLAYRQITDKAKARQYKAENFDYATFSGIFSKRSDANLLKHAGLLTIDFDHIPNVEKLKGVLLCDEYFDTELLFTSPSGDGLKWVIPIDLTKGTHLIFFNAVAAYIAKTYQLEVDRSGKDVSRACFLPFDPNSYINPKYLQQ